MIRSAYFRPSEDRILREVADAAHTTPNTVIRLAVRMLVGLPVPEWANDLRREEHHGRT